MYDSLRGIAAFIFLYCTLIKETKRVDGMIRLDSHDTDIFEHTLSEKERIEHKFIIEESKMLLSKFEATNMLKIINLIIIDLMKEISFEELDELCEEIKKLTFYQNHS